MSMANTLENQVLALLFNNDAITGVGDVSGVVGSSADGSLYISFHTGSPGEAGDQTTNEATYTSYARVGVARATWGWVVTDNTVVNAAAITFPKCTGGAETLTHVGIGSASSGAGKLLFFAALTSSIPVSNNVTPQIGPGDLSVSID